MSAISGVFKQMKYRTMFTVSLFIKIFFIFYGTKNFNKQQPTSKSVINSPAETDFKLKNIQKFPKCRICQAVFGGNVSITRQKQLLTTIIIFPFDGKVQL